MPGEDAPRDHLLNGIIVLESVLVPKAFTFRLRGEGKGSGGNFAWGEFVRDDRRLALHFRWNLGLVRYHIGDHSASHESYMRELGVWSRCEYPGFSDDATAAFVGLAHDLLWADDFLVGTGSILRQAAAKEAVLMARRQQEEMARYVGDTRSLERLQMCFHARDYSKVLALAKELKYPERMTPVQRRMVELAQVKAGRRNWLTRVIRALIPGARAAC